MTTRRQTPSREHDLRMHLGVILMALQMLSRPPTAPMQPDQQELIDIIKRAAKSMQELLDTPPAQPVKKPVSKRKKS